MGTTIKNKGSFPSPKHFLLWEEQNRVYKNLRGQLLVSLTSVPGLDCSISTRLGHDPDPEATCPRLPFPCSTLLHSVGHPRLPRQLAYSWGRLIGGTHRNLRARWTSQALSPPSASLWFQLPPMGFLGARSHPVALAPELS
jgi:hypothetical protein